MKKSFLHADLLYFYNIYIYIYSITHKYNIIIVYEYIFTDEKITRIATATKRLNRIQIT